MKKKLYMNSDNSDSPFSSPGPPSRSADAATTHQLVRSATSTSQKLSATVVSTARLELKSQVEKRIQDLQRQKTRAEQEVSRIEREITRLVQELDRITQPPHPISRMCCVM